jgi:hypothetical protein
MLPQAGFALNAGHRVTPVIKRNRSSKLPQAADRPA